MVCIEYLRIVYFVAIVQYSASVKSVPQTVSCVSETGKTALLSHPQIPGYSKYP